MFDPREHDALVRFAASFVGDDWAEDIVQDYYLKVLNGEVPAFRRQASRLTFAMQIVKYTCFRWLEHERRLPLLWPLLEDDHIILPQYEDVLDAKRQLARLTHMERMVLTLMGEDPSYDSVGTILGITPKAVRGRTYRARQRLKERIA